MIKFRLPVFYLDQKRVYEIKCCSCYLDQCVYKLTVLSNIEEFYDEFLEYNAFINFYDGCIIVCRYNFIKFAIFTNDGNIREQCTDIYDESCLDVCLDEKASSDFDFCFVCEITISFFLIDRLQTIVLSKSE